MVNPFGPVRTPNLKVSMLYAGKSLHARNRIGHIRRVHRVAPSPLSDIPRLLLTFIHPHCHTIDDYPNIVNSPLVAGDLFRDDDLICATSESLARVAKTLIFLVHSVNPNPICSKLAPVSHILRWTPQTVHAFMPHLRPVNLRPVGFQSVDIQPVAYALTSCLRPSINSPQTSQRQTSGSRTSGPPMYRPPTSHRPQACGLSVACGLSPISRRPPASLLVSRCLRTRCRQGTRCLQGIGHCPGTSHLQVP